MTARYGHEAPLSPCPPDFREVYLRLGQDRAIEEYYRCNWRCIVRWIEEAGGEALRAERRAISVEPRGRPDGQKRYVLGRTLTAVNGRKKGE